ncbi:MAG: cation:proton antiporter [Nocardiopsaceae bacterium]|jgi:Kef-type K+ transport system membrane component KefB|nr:cation:proton antiporter [Nocardiopsaceae bacterium]
MTDADVQLLLFDLALIIVLARLLGALARRMGQPPVLGEIVAGILLGPTIWGTNITGTLFPASLLPPLTALANLGLVFFMFVVGYEVDLGLVTGRGRVAAGVALGSIIAPLVLGIALAGWFVHRYHPRDTTSFILFLGTAMAITAFPVLARILSDRGLHRTRVGGLALAAASVDDVLAWGLLAVVIAVAGAGSGHGELRLALAPVYAAVMIWLVRPALRWLARFYERQRRLTPNLLAAVLALLLLSSYATDWMGVKFIFGAFIFGIVMPRDVPALREAILERLEQVSVLVLLPVFFVVAGLNVNLRGIGLSGLVDLVLIMLVAVAGKFGGAYFGARLTGVQRRQAGALAALMNTRGLTELVILTVGLQLGILNKALFTLMVVMAIVTTGMAGPLLRVIYPSRIMERDIAEADRAALGEAAAHRIVVLIDDPETAGPLVDVGSRLAASRQHSQLVLSHLVPHRPAGRLEVGAGLGGELLQMTQTMSKLQGLAAQAGEIPAMVQSRFSDDVRAELPGYVAAANPGTVVLRGGQSDALGAYGATQLVYLLRTLPAEPGAAVARVTRGPDGDAAVQVAAQLSVGSGLDLVLTPSGRAATSVAESLSNRGLRVRAGNEPADGIVIAPVAGTDADSPETVTADGRVGDVHLAVVAGTSEASDDMDNWVEALDLRTEQQTAGSRTTESRRP